MAGERPLSDFEPGLYKGEGAAFLLSENLGWGLVPLTVIREDAPLGVGSLQWFIHCNFQEHYFTLYEDASETHRELARIALFDYVANNTDRKSGHVLRGDDGLIWGIDHGLCFSADFKLRTVIWDFAGDPIPDALLEDIAPLAEASPPEVPELLNEDEIAALQHRVQRMMLAGVPAGGPNGHALPLAAGLGGYALRQLLRAKDFIQLLLGHRRPWETSSTPAGRDGSTLPSGARSHAVLSTAGIG